MGHNALEIAATASNVTIGPSSGYSDVPPGEDFIGAGQREIQSSMTLDGVSIMNNLITIGSGTAQFRHDLRSADAKRQLPCAVWFLPGVTRQPGQQVGNQ